MMIYCVLFHYSISAVSNTKATVESGGDGFDRYYHDS